MRKVVITIILGVFLLVGFASSAQAGWYYCKVERTGPSASTSFVALTDKNGAFTNRWFGIEKTREEEFLATALTAIAL